MHGSGESTPDHGLTVGEVFERTERSLAADEAEATVSGVFLGNGLFLDSDHRWVMVRSPRPYSRRWEEISRNISEALADETIEVQILFTDGMEHTRRGSRVWTGPRRS